MQPKPSQARRIRITTNTPNVKAALKKEVGKFLSTHHGNVTIRWFEDTEKENVVWLELDGDWFLINMVEDFIDAIGGYS